MSKKLNENKLASDKAYEARGIIARMNKIGTFETAPNFHIPVYQFLSLDCGKDKPAVLVEYVGQAPYDPKTLELDFAKLKEGDIIIDPGILYRKREWTAPLMTEHLSALKKYKPKTIIKSYVDKEKPTTDIILDPHNVTKQ